MSRLSLLAVLCTVMIAAPSVARLSASSRQSPTPRAGAVPAASPQGRTTPPPPPAAPPPASQATGPALRLNVRFELSISEASAGATTTKNVVLITSNGTRGSIRSDMQSPTEANVILNVDAHPQIQPDGRISVDLAFMYTPQRSVDAGAAGAHTTDIQEQMNVLLTDGKPLVVSQSADPRGDRKVTVEVTATILK